MPAMLNARPYALLLTAQAAEQLPVRICDLFDQFGDLQVHTFHLRVVCRVHPLQMAQAQQVQELILSPQALHLFLFHVVDKGEAHREPP
jgi:hypothetical protein